MERESWRATGEVDFAQSTLGISGQMDAVVVNHQNGASSFEIWNSFIASIHLRSQNLLNKKLKQNHATFHKLKN